MDLNLDSNESRNGHQGHSVTGRLSSWDYASILLLIGVCLWGIHLVPQLGVSWDEHYHHQWGAEKWHNYAGLFTGRISFDEFLNLRHSSVHPGFFDLCVQAVLQFSPFGANETGHFLSYTFGLLGLLAVWLTGRHLMGRMGGFLALLLLICAPRYFGHMFFNPKDIPFAACYIWAIYFLLKAISGFPKPNVRTLLMLGAVTGLALGVRMAGLLIPLYFGLFALVYYLLNLRSLKRPVVVLLGLAWRGGMSALIAYLCALPFWPALWKSPFGGVGKSVGEAQHFGWNGPVLYDGAFELSTQLPWHYLPKWVLITLPEWTLVLLAVAVCLSVYLIVKHPRRLMESRALQWGAVALAGVFPLLYVIVTGPTLYDGMRHFLFILPPLMLVAAGGAIGGVHFLAALELRFKWVCAMPVGVSLLSCLFLITNSYVALYPYNYIYFNGWVGGLGGAYNNYETDYWGLSYREAMETLGAYVEQERIVYPERQYTVAMSGAGALAEPFLPDGFLMTSDREVADFYVAYTRVNRHMKGSGTVVALVEREGVPLNVIWDQRKSQVVE